MNKFEELVHDLKNHTIKIPPKNIITNINKHPSIRMY